MGASCLVIGSPGTAPNAVKWRVRESILCVAYYVFRFASYRNMVSSPTLSPWCCWCRSQRITQLGRWMDGCLYVKFVTTARHFIFVFYFFVCAPTALSANNKINSLKTRKREGGGGYLWISYGVESECESRIWQKYSGDGWCGSCIEKKKKSKGRNACYSQWVVLVADVVEFRSA